MDLKPKPLYKGMTDSSRRPKELPGLRPSTELTSGETVTSANIGISEEDLASAFGEPESTDPTDLTLPTDDRVFEQNGTEPGKESTKKLKKLPHKIPILVGNVGQCWAMLGAAVSAQMLHL